MARVPSADEERRTAEVAEALMRRGHVQEPGEGPPPEVADSAVPARRRKPFERKPFGTWDQKLAYPSREGFHRHWFNDEPGRIMRAKDAGYTHVNDEAGKPVSTVVGIGRGGQPLVAFLMEILEEYYREDMAAQEQVVHGLMTQIGRGEHSRPRGQDGDLRYAGSSNWGDIKIETGTRARR